MQMQSMTYLFLYFVILQVVNLLLYLNNYKIFFLRTICLKSEERALISERIKISYGKRAQTYEELLELCSAVEEELIYNLAPSRLDYFKLGTQCLKRFDCKKKEMQNIKSVASSCLSSAEAITDDTTRNVKRSKTQH
jgi:hypothetical protein